MFARPGRGEPRPLWLRGQEAGDLRRLTEVPAGQSPRRLDVFVRAQSARVSRAMARRWIEGGLVTVNDRRATPAQRIRPGDVIACHVAVREPAPVEPEPIPLAVLHEDAALLVVDKPPGLVMHPAPGHWSGTLLNALLHHLDPGARVAAGARAGGEPARPGLVHRLDRGTSGVLVVARTAAAHRELARQFRAHSVHRVYLAIVAGALRGSGRVDLALSRDPRDRRRVAGAPAGGRRAVTDFRVVERLGFAGTLVEARPHTGRMHQIRVHLASLGHPVLGDETYGGAAADASIDRPMLHAGVLGFHHPDTGGYVEYRAPLPPDMEAVLARHRSARAAAGEAGEMRAAGCAARISP